MIWYVKILIQINWFNVINKVNIFKFLLRKKFVVFKHFSDKAENKLRQCNLGSKHKGQVKEV